MLKPILLAKSAVLTSLAVFGSPDAVRSQAAQFELQSRPVTSFEIADGAPAGVVFDLFVTTDRDINFVSLYEATPELFYQHDLGSDVAFDAGTLSCAPSHGPIPISTALESNTPIPEPNSATLRLLGTMGQLLRSKAA